ncbi:hypothetical protein HaLaN_15184 [Haematococcus lacustris]|uniref:Uncharacterized protein n=1 Tax=Haematococcus lacustris TaxID=44745 RepID=A0A699ZH31_HAELA|nr:hypothetical protein HaLaN_15184 [Haematococcus lacustris]
MATNHSSSAYLLCVPPLGSDSYSSGCPSPCASMTVSSSPKALGAQHPTLRQISNSNFWISA